MTVFLCEDWRDVMHLLTTLQKEVAQHIEIDTVSEPYRWRVLIEEVPR